MRSEQRKPVLVVLDLLHGNLPSPDRMALLASRSELPLVNVGVAIGALGPHIAEHQLGMACGTADAHVHAAQREFRLVVIKFWDAADRLPSAEGVAVLARDIEWAVGATRRGGVLRRGTDRKQGRQQCRNQDYSPQHCPHLPDADTTCNRTKPEESRRLAK